MSFWTWMRQAALILVGRNANGTNPRASSEYQALAIDQTTRELMALAQLRLRDIAGAADIDAAADTAGRLLTVPTGTQATPFLQDAGNKLYVIPVGTSDFAFLQHAGGGQLVVSKPGAIAASSTLATIHLSTVANTLIFSAPGTQEFNVEQIIMANNNALSISTTLSRSTAGNASRLFRGSVISGDTRVFQGPFHIVPGKPLRGSSSIGPGLTVNVEGYRTK